MSTRVPGTFHCNPLKFIRSNPSIEQDLHSPRSNHTLNLPLATLWVFHWKRGSSLKSYWRGESSNVLNKSLSRAFQKDNNQIRSFQRRVLLDLDRPTNKALGSAWNDRILNVVGESTLYWKTSRNLYGFHAHFREWVFFALD